MAHDIFFGEIDELYLIDVGEYALGFDQAAALARRQVNLRHVARNHGLRAEADARQKHLHLLARRVLSFVQDDESIRERPAPHESQWRDFDNAFLQELRHALKVNQVKERVVEW